MRCSSAPPPRLGAVLRGLDTIAVDSMEVVLRPLGQEVPPALVYPEKGLGAAVLRAGIRLWDQGGLSPVAAIKVTRHNLIHPTAHPARDGPPVEPPRRLERRAR